MGLALGQWGGKRCGNSGQRWKMLEERGPLEHFLLWLEEAALHSAWSFVH